MPQPFYLWYSLFSTCPVWSAYRMDACLVPYNKFNVWTFINRTFSQTHASSLVYLNSKMSVKSSAQLLYTDSKKVNLEIQILYNTNIKLIQEILLRTNFSYFLKYMSFKHFTCLPDKAINLSPQTKIHEKIKFASLLCIGNGWQCNKTKEVEFQGWV